MTRSGNNIIIRRSTIRIVTGVVGAMAIIWPVLGFGVGYVIRDHDQQKAIDGLKEDRKKDMEDIETKRQADREDILKAIDKLDGRCQRIEDYLLGKR
jgi:hypothetical protein